MKRFDKGYVYSGLVTDLFYSALAVFAFLGEFFTDEETGGTDMGVLAIVFAIAFAVVYLCFVTYRVLYYRTSGYELTDREIRCQRGVLFRKRSVLDYKRVHAINKKQNIVQRIFGIAVLTVDSGSANTSHRAEITIIERSDVADALLDRLNSLKGDAAGKCADESATEEVLFSDKDSLYRFTSGKKMLYTLVNIASAAFFTLLIAVPVIIAVSACKMLLQLDFLGTWGQYLVGAALIASGAVLLSTFFSFIGSVVYSFLGYYDFTVTRRDGNVLISYGLFEKHTNTFSYDRIKAVKISQGLLQRIFGFASVRLEVIGYTVSSDDGKSDGLGVLIPFCRYGEIGEILGKILPDHIPEEKQTCSVSLFPFVSWFLLIFGIALVLTMSGTLAVMAILGASAEAIAAVSLVLFGAALAVLAFKLVSAVLSYHTNGISVRDGKVTAYSGGFNKHITVFMAKHLVAVEDVTTPLRRKHGIASPVMHLKTNESTNEIKVHIQKAELFDELEKLLTT